MKMLYLIIPISLLLIGLAIWVFLWAVRSGQYEDLDAPAVRILLDDDEPPQASPAATKPNEDEDGDA